MGYEQIIILVIVVISAIVIAKKFIKNRYPKKSVTDDKKDTLDNLKQEQNEKALDTLKERLAKGKITKEEYDSLKKEFE